eukprot:NODE_983_length_2555_cov_0.219463.p1 type:complete len:341 gc:universal NODE_983_length_2555_cov_0.219463:2007-985(-)
MSDGDTSFLLICGAMVFIMIPGLGYFYSGMANSKSALSMLLLCFVSYSIVMLQWFLFGYSLVFSSDGGSFIGTLTNGVFSSMTSKSAANGGYPDFAYAFYQSTFAGISPALVIGATAERARLLPKMVFIFFWSTFVYDFIAYWSWGPHGWLKINGSLDFAGGSPVHIASGAAALAYTLVVGKKTNLPSVAHSPSNVILGTMLLWFGWNGFNGGNATGANGRAAAAIMATNLAAASGSLTWLITDYIRKGKFSAISFCCGAVAGLVSVTPASGFVSPSSGVLIGFIGSLSCNFAAKLKNTFKFDDTVMFTNLVRCVCNSWSWGNCRKSVNRFFDSEILAES